MFAHETKFHTNIDNLRSAFSVSDPAIYYACASLLTATGRVYRAKDLEWAGELAKKRADEGHDLHDDEAAVFSALLAANPNGVIGLRKAEEIYQILRKRFPESIMLPVSSLYIAGLQQPVDEEKMATMVCRLYDQLVFHNIRLKPSKLPILGCLVSTGRTLGELDQEVLRCRDFLSGMLKDGLTTISCVLACGHADVSQKCTRYFAFCRSAELNGISLPLGSGTAVMGLFSMMDEKMDTVIKDVTSVSKSMKDNGLFDFIGEAQRNMYAALLVSSEYGRSYDGDDALSIMAAHQAAVAADFVRAAFRAGRNMKSMTVIQT